MRIEAFRHRSSDLGEDIVDRAVRFADLARFADAQDDRQAGGKAGFGLGAHIVVALGETFAALTMPDDHNARADVGEHLRRDRSGEGA